MPRLEFPKFSHGNVRSDKLGIVQILEERKLGTKGILKKNKRTEYFWGRCFADPVAACYLTSPTEHAEVTKMHTRVSWPADGAAFTRAAVMEKQTVAFTTLSKIPCCLSCCKHANFPWDAQWTDIMPSPQIGFVRVHALQLCAIPPDANRIPKSTLQGEGHFPHSCLLPYKKENGDIFSVRGSDLS